MHGADGMETGATQSAGAVLHAERRRQNLSIGDVSRHLKLSVRQVEALERDEFTTFGGAVFVHGFLRNYAKLLGIDAVPLIAAADGVLGSSGARVTGDRSARSPVAVAGAEATTDEVARSPVIALLLVMAIVVAGVAGWMLTREQATEADDTEEVASVSESIGEPQIRVGQAPADAPMTEPGADIEPQQTEAAAIASAPAQAPVSSQPAAGVPLAVVTMVFRQESWVEITDRSGEIVYSRLNGPGASQRIRARPPLSVVIGNSSGVDLYFNDKAVDLTPYTRVDVARLNLE